MKETYTPVPDDLFTFYVSEIFYSYQAEGFFAGTPACFVRLAECNQNCPFCDTKAANQVNELMKKQDLMELVQKYLNTTGIKHIVVTGGEPFFRNSYNLAELLKILVYLLPIGRIQIETNGSIALGLPVLDYINSQRARFWITVSPKKLPVHPIYYNMADELKLLVGNLGANNERALAYIPDPEAIVKEFEENRAALREPLKLAFQPLWYFPQYNNAPSSQTVKMDALSSLMVKCLKLACKYQGRLSLQTNKFVDWR